MIQAVNKSDKNCDLLYLFSITRIIYIRIVDDNRYLQKTADS